MSTLRAQVANCLAFLKTRRDDAADLRLRLLLDSKVEEVERTLAEMPPDRPRVVGRIRVY